MIDVKIAYTKVDIETIAVNNIWILVDVIFPLIVSTIIYKGNLCGSKAIELIDEATDVAVGGNGWMISGAGMVSPRWWLFCYGILYQFGKWKCW